MDAGTFLLTRAYARLATCRTYTMGGAAPIPAWAIWKWCDRNELDRDAAEFAEAVFITVDHAILTKLNARKE